MSEFPDCPSVESQRDGRGLWATRCCQKAAGHDSGHSYGPWRYNVPPPDTITRSQAEARLDEPTVRYILNGRADGGNSVQRQDGEAFDDWLVRALHGGHEEVRRRMLALLFPASERGDTQ